MFFVAYSFSSSTITTLNHVLYLIHFILSGNFPMKVAYTYVQLKEFPQLIVLAPRWALKHQLRSSWALPYSRAQLSISTRRDLCTR